MTVNELFALTPLLIVSGISVVLMLVLCLIRNHKTIFFLHGLGLIVACYFLIEQFGVDAIQVTPLIIIDEYSRFFIAFILLTSLAISFLAYDYFEKCNDIREEFYILLSLATLGACVLVSSNHFVSFFIGLELLGISLFSMVGYRVNNQHFSAISLEASIKYLVLSGISSAFLLFGIALIYAETGSLSFSSFASQIGEPMPQIFSYIGTAMIFVGLAFKLSWVPFHMWTPDVYEGAPTPVTAFLATISKLSVAAVILRLLQTAQLFDKGQLIEALTLVAILSMLIGNFLALLQTNLKRLLAYSSIAHFGYLIIAFLGTHTYQLENQQLAMEAVTFYLLGYVPATLAAFGVMTILATPETGQDAQFRQNYRSLFWTHPLLALVLALSMLSLAGIPLTIGFMGKFYLFSVGVAEKQWLLLGSMVVGSTLGIYYYLKVFMELFISPIPAQKSNFKLGLDSQTIAASTGSNLVLILSGTIIVWLGCYPGPMIALLQQAISSF